MTYVVYHINSTQRIKNFKSESGAKRSTTCMNRNAANSKYASLDGISPYAYTDLENYEKNVVYKKKVINLMSGKEIEIDSNTPHCCDPSTETYWSM
jgi:hypothetical protein